MQDATQNQTSNKTSNSPVVEIKGSAPAKIDPAMVQAATLASGATLAPSDGIGPVADSDTVLETMYVARRAETRSNHAVLAKAVVKAADRDEINSVLSRIRAKCGMLKSRKSSTIARS